MSAGGFAFLVLAAIGAAAWHTREWRARRIEERRSNRDLIRERARPPGP